jgi:hypothetical protein
VTQPRAIVPAIGTRPGPASRRGARPHRSSSGRRSPWHRGLPPAPGRPLGSHRFPPRARCGHANGVVSGGSENALDPPLRLLVHIETARDRGPRSRRGPRHGSRHLDPGRRKGDAEVAARDDARLRAGCRRVVTVRSGVSIRMETTRLKAGVALAGAGDHRGRTVADDLWTIVRGNRPSRTHDQLSGYVDFGRFGRFGRSIPEVRQHYYFSLRAFAPAPSRGRLRPPAWLNKMR